MRVWVGNVRATRPFVALVAGLFLCGWAAPAASATARPTAGPTPISSCDFPSLQSAVAEGGSYAFTCSGTIAFTEPLIVAAGQVVSLQGTGQHVILDGGGATQLFAVNGRLTLRRLSLANANVAGEDGTDGTSGQPGGTGATCPVGNPCLAGDGGHGGNQGDGGDGGDGGDAGTNGTADLGG